MSEHPSPQQLELYRTRAMPPQDLLALDRHIAACEVCRQQLPARATPFLDAAEDVRRRHLTYEGIERYAEGRLDETARQAMEAHLELCAECTDQLRDFRSFADELARPVVVRKRREAAPVSRLTALWTWCRQPRHALALGALVVLAVLVPVSQKTGGPTSSSLQSDRAALPRPVPDRLAEVPEARRAMVQHLLNGDEVRAVPIPRSLSQLSDAERAEWSRLSTALANDPPLLAAVAMDFGLYCDASRLLASDNSEPARRLRDAAGGLCKER